MGSWQRRWCSRKVLYLSDSHFDSSFDPVFGNWAAVFFTVNVLKLFLSFLRILIWTDPVRNSFYSLLWYEYVIFIQMSFYGLRINVTLFCCHGDMFIFTEKCFEFWLFCFSLICSVTAIRSFFRKRISFSAGHGSGFQKKTDRLLTWGRFTF